LQKLVGKPIRAASAGPSTGPLVMLLQPNNGSGRVSSGPAASATLASSSPWTASVAGFSALRPIPRRRSQTVIEQLINLGKVQRAILASASTSFAPKIPPAKRFAQIADRPAAPCR